MPNQKIAIRKAKKSDYNFLKEKICQLRLDNESLEVALVLIAEINGVRAGFIRIKEHETCAEICSLGVLEKYRLRGVARALTKTQLKTIKKAVYLVATIPSFFFRFGFEIVQNYPKEIAEKKLHCEKSLAVPEKYVVMKRK